MDDQPENWPEYRRLVIQQFATLDTSMRDLSSRVDRFNEAARDRAIEATEKANKAVNDLHVRVSMLEQSAKLGGAIAGTIAGAIVSIIIVILTKVIWGGLKP